MYHTLADSGVVVRVYNGETEKAQYTYPVEDKNLDGKVWPVFTINAATRSPAPLMRATPSGTTSW